MKKFLKVTLALVMAAIVAIGAFAGCSAVMKDYEVGTVGNMKIMASAYYNQCASYAQMYSYYGLSADLYMDDIKDTVFDQMVDQYLPIYQAKKQKIQLDENDKAIIQENLDAFVKESIASYKSQVDPSITDEAAITAEAEKLFKAAVEAGGQYKYDEYINKVMYTEYENVRLAEKLQEKVIADANINITEEDVRKLYDDELKAEKEQFAANPADYYSMYSSYISTMNGSDEEVKKTAVKPFIVPEGYYFVTHILVMNPAEGEEKDVDAIVAEIQAELAKLPETAAAEEKIAKFNELIEKYNEDPGLKNEPYKTEGYLMHEALNTEESTTYDPAFYDAAIALEKEGDISEPVKGQNGTHIIIRLGDVDSTTQVSFEEVSEALELNLKAQKEDEAYTAALAQWRAETKVTKNESRIKALNITVPEDLSF